MLAFAFCVWPASHAVPYHFTEARPYLAAHAVSQLKVLFQPARFGHYGIFQLHNDAMTAWAFMRVC